MKQINIFHFVCIGLIALMCSSIAPTLAYAAPSPTPKASPTPKPTVSPKPSADPEASDEANIDPETIKENIKRRIEQAVKTQSTSETKKKIAFIGTLSSVTTNSFTLETLQGEVKQASIRDTVRVIELPKNKEVKIEDISIGDYVAALGYLNETTKVLEAKRILTLKTPPTTDLKKSTFGSITKIDTKKSSITITNPKTNEEKVIFYTKKTDFSISNGIQKQDLDPKKISLNSQAAVIYLVEGPEYTATTVIMKTNDQLEIDSLEVSAASSSAKR